MNIEQKVREIVVDFKHSHTITGNNGKNITVDQATKAIMGLIREDDEYKYHHYCETHEYSWSDNMLRSEQKDCPACLKAELKAIKDRASEGEILRILIQNSGFADSSLERDAKALSKRIRGEG